VDIFDLLLGPGQRQEQERIRRLAKQVAKGPTREGGKAAMAKRAVSETGFLGLAVLTLEQLLVEKGIITRQEFADRLRRLDDLDGVRDGEIDQRTLMSALGFSVGPAQAARHGAGKTIPVAKLVRSQVRPGENLPPRRKESGTAARPGGQLKVRPAVKPPAPAAAVSERPAAPRSVESPKARSVVAPPPEPAPAPPAHPVAPAAEAAPLDPSTLGQTAFEDYFGKAQPEDE
jgi:hypothetical protein